MLVRCIDCKNFIADKIGDGTGIGRCIVYGQYKRSGASTNDIQQLLVRLGNKWDNELFWGGTATDRECEYFC